MDLFKYDKQYYNTRELLENINFALNFTGKDVIIQSDIYNWAAKGFLPKREKEKWSKSQYLSVLGFVYLRRVLGLNLDKIKGTQDLLITLVEHPKTAFHKNNLQLLKLYNG